MKLHTTLCLCFFTGHLLAAPFSNFAYPDSLEQEEIPSISPRHDEGIFTLEGKVARADNAGPIAGAEVLITDLYRNVSRRVYTDQEGKFQCMLEKDAFYSIMTVKKSYFDAAIQKVSTIGLKTPQKIEKFIPMSKVELNKTYQLEGINFEPNQASFNQEALQALGQILDFLRHHPGAVVEIGVHTDARGDDEHNLHLSQQRAEQIAMFLYRKGISKKQLIAAGYGETTPVNECRNGVKCTSIQHQANRRVEFKIVSMKI